MHKLKVLAISIILVMALSLVGPSFDVAAIATSPTMGAAASFSVLAALSMSAAGAGTTVSGDLGLSPGLAASKTGPWTVGGSQYFGPAPSLSFTAQADALSAFNNLVGQASDGGWAVSPWSPTPGVRTVALDTTFNGTITLSGGEDDVWVFQVGRDMTFTGSVVLAGKAQACHVFWQIGRDATIAVGSTFVGTLIASRDVTLVSGATVNGRIISLNSSLTTDGNTISGPTCAPRLSKNFSPASITSGGGAVSTLTITLTNISETAATLTSAFTDNLPGGVVIAATPNAATTCGGGGPLTAVPGGSAVTMPAGRIIPGSGTCTLSVNVTIPAALTACYINNVPINALVTSVGNNVTAASATLCGVAPPTPTPVPAVVPGTGFAPQHLTVLSAQPAEKAYADLGDLWLEIPRLGVKMPIVGVPQTNGTWDVSWLGKNAGWLNGSAFPTWKGNSVITGHVYDAYGNAGPFVHLNWLWWGDKVIVHAWGAQYVYEVRAVTQVQPNDKAAMMKHEELPWVTLVTCRGYDQASNSYKYRVLVRAVLVEVK